MNDALFGISLALIAIVLLTAFFTLCSMWLWRVIALRYANLSANKIERFTFIIRISPILLSVFCLLSIFIPAFWLHEPPHADETLTLELAALALLCSVCFVWAVYRSLISWLNTRKIVLDWMHKAEALDFENVSAPVYQIEHSYPLVAVVGMFSPKIFIAKKVFEILTEDELAAALAHEHSHVLKRHNLKRWVFNFCRDMMGFIPCKQVERDWNKAIEFSADDKAARQTVNGALDLASALVKLSRAVPKDSYPTLPAGAYIGGESSHAIAATRVKRLLQISEGKTLHRNDASLLNEITVWSGMSSAFFAFFLLLTQTDFLYFVHHAIEQVIKVIV